MQGLDPCLQVATTSRGFDNVTLRCSIVFHIFFTCALHAESEWLCVRKKASFQLSRRLNVLLVFAFVAFEVQARGGLAVRVKTEQISHFHRICRKCVCVCECVLRSTVYSYTLLPSFLLADPVQQSPFQHQTGITRAVKESCSIAETCDNTSSKCLSVQMQDASSPTAQLHPLHNQIIDKVSSLYYTNQHLPPVHAANDGWVDG